MTELIGGGRSTLETSSGMARAIPETGGIALSDPDVQRLLVDDEPGRHASAARTGGPWVSHVAVPLAATATFAAVALVDWHGWLTWALTALVVAAWVGLVVRASADVAGVTLWCAACGSVAAWSLARAGGVLPGVTGMVVVVTATSLAGFVWLAAEVRSGARLRDATRDAWNGVFQPRNAAAAWVIGAGLALPLMGYASPRVIDVDSSWLAISTRYVQTHGVGLLQHNQEVYLPHLLIGPALRIGGYQAAVGLNIAGVMGVASLAGVLAYALTRRGVGAVVASAAVLSMPALVFQAYRLSLYGPMLVLGYLGCWLVHRSMRTPAGPAWWAAAGGFCLVLSSEAHALGRLFLVVPFLLLVLHPHRNAVRRLGVTLVAIAVASIPRLWLNLSVGGTDRLLSTRNDFLIEQGYLRLINRNWHGYATESGPLGYLQNLPSLGRGAFGHVTILVLLALVVVALFTAHRRALLFGSAVVITFVGALVVIAPGTYSRYLLPLSIGLAVVAGVGGARLVERSSLGTAGGVLLSVAMVLFAISTITPSTHRFRTRISRDVVSADPSSLVPPGEAVLGVRSSKLVYRNPDRDVLNSRVLSERDFVTYLTWPSDEAVLEMLRRNDVRWIVVLDRGDLEVNYHESWLLPTYGKPDVHQERLWESDHFCRGPVLGQFHFYVVGECPSTS